jgi:hypothetical protein
MEIEPTLKNANEYLLALKSSSPPLSPEIAQLASHLHNLCVIIEGLNLASQSHEKRLRRFEEQSDLQSGAAPFRAARR